IRILSKPEKPQERLAEIVYRCFGVDIQVDAVQFAYFLSAFTDIDGFEAMPWAERELVCRNHYGTSAVEKTLRNWCHQLLEKQIITKCVESAAWKTTIVGKKKMRERILPDNREVVWDYYNRRSEIFAEEYKEILPLALSRGETSQKARNEAWSATYKRLWQEFDCCYYYCKCFVLGAFTDQYTEELWEVYELSQQLAAEASERVEASRNKPPTTKEEFDRQWFSQKTFVKLD
ncbi:MAG: hypothetical protein II049_09015, partial [Clostridia bacterium]|nr:hypothetical protein [Clostridia bacterium]